MLNNNQIRNKPKFPLKTFIFSKKGYGNRPRSKAPLMHPCMFIKKEVDLWERSAKI